MRRTSDATSNATGALAAVVTGVSSWQGIHVTVAVTLPLASGAELNEQV